MGSFGEGLAKFHRNRRVWETRRATPTLVREAAVGARVCVRGTIDGETLLRTPIRHASAVAYVARIDELVPIEGKRFSRPLVTEEQRVAFLVIDDEGSRVRVEEGPAILGDPPIDVGERVSWTRNDGLAALAKGERLSAHSHALLEVHLAPGDRVLVVGFVGEGADVVSTGYRDAAGKMKTLRGTDDEPLVIVKA